MMFVDDLLMFTRGDIMSIELMYAEFMKFSKASGLKANTEKSCSRLCILKMEHCS